VNTTISIDYNDERHGLSRPDTEGFAVNRPEVATLSNLLPGTYRVFANVWRAAGDENQFGAMTSVGIYLGNGKDKTVLVDTVNLKRERGSGGGKWLYAGLISVTSTQKLCSSSSQVLQAIPVEGKLMCYTWVRAGYVVGNPLAVRYGATHIRIAAASGREDSVEEDESTGLWLPRANLPDFSAVQYAVHAGGMCTAQGQSYACSDSALVGAGQLGPLLISQEKSEGWQITVYPIFFPFESGAKYWLVLKYSGYFTTVLSMENVIAHKFGTSPSNRTAVMIETVEEGALRVILKWQKITDGDVYIFKNPIPMYYLNTSSNTLSPTSSVSTVNISNGGSGYTSAPTVVFRGGGGSGASATAFVSNGAVTSIVMTSGGSGYTSAPAITFTGGGGTGASATAATATSSVSTVTISAGGRNYTSAPTVVFRGGGGSGASATAFVTNGAVTSIVMTSGGSGYISAPTISFTGGGGTGAAASAFTGATATSSVSTVTISAGGSGYTSAPTVVFRGGGGSGASATAFVSNGAVTSIVMTSGGRFYTSAPTISFTGGGGTGASAYAATAATAPSRPAPTPGFVWWWDKQGLPGVELQMDCQTKPCGMENVYFSNVDSHMDVEYTVAVNVYAGVLESSRDGKCRLSRNCSLQGTSSRVDEEIEFYDTGGLIARVKVAGRYALLSFVYTCKSDFYVIVFVPYSSDVGGGTIKECEFVCPCVFNTEQ
jgi:hypothetical protein